jgi:Tfp pilus assembly protein PilV
MLPKNRLPRRKATTLLECTVALLVLSVAMMGVAQLVVTASHQRRQSVARKLALQEIANQAERVAAMSWDEAAPDKLTRWEPSADLLAPLPDASCRVIVEDEAGPPAARRIRLEVVWSDPAGHEQQPVGVTLWKYQTEARP